MTRPGPIQKTSTTTTPGDVPARANAPSFIHFLGIDAEGPSSKFLKGLPFSTQQQLGGVAGSTPDQHSGK
jgi:hypothetical protein